MAGILTPYGVDFDESGYSTARMRAFSFSLIGNIGYNIDFGNCGSGGMHVKVISGHWSGGYSVFRESYLMNASSDDFSEYNQANQTSGTIGAITFSRPEAGKIRVTKSAGSYAGGANTTIVFLTHHNVYLNAFGQI